MKIVIADSHGNLYISCQSQIIRINLNSENTNSTCNSNSAAIKHYEHLAKGEAQLLAIEVDSKGKYLFGCYDNKALCCWNAETGELLGNITAKKRPVCLVYAPYQDRVATGEEIVREALVFSDKAGEIWGCDVPLLRKQVLLGAHTTSIITDMVRHKTLLVSADRDEKIRVTRFPDLIHIVSYCLEHTSVVSSVTFIGEYSEPSLMLASVSWDNTLCIWNPVNGQLLKKFSTSNNLLEEIQSAVSVSSTAVDASSSVANTIEEKDRQEKVQSENSASDDNDDANEDEKEYDEASAGNYPCKLVAMKKSPVLAVVFKNSPVVKLAIISDNVGNKGGLVDTVSYDLPSVPLDIVFVESRLVLLMPEPTYFKVLDVDVSSNKLVVKEQLSEIVETANLLQEKGNNTLNTILKISIYNNDHYKFIIH